MDLGELFQNTLEFAKDNVLIAVIAGIVLIIFFYRRPKLLISILLLAAMIYGLFSMIMSIGESSSHSKQRLLNKGEKQLERLE